MRRNWLALAVILIGAPGCDNVTWGGVEMRLEPPPDRADLVEGTALGEGTEATDELPPLPDGPLLLAGSRNGSTGDFTVVAEIRPDGLADLLSEAQAPGFHDHLRQERLPPGTEFVLFANGVRVGRMVSSRTGVDESWCNPRVTVSGMVELMPDALDATHFLALPSEVADVRPYGVYTQTQYGDAEGRAVVNLGTQAIAQLGAQWPNSMRGALGDADAFHMDDAGGTAVAGTFTYLDEIEVAETDERAYSLFVLGTRGAGGYERAFTLYRPVQSEGKGAARYFSHMDWDRDGRTEILLEVFGTESRWFAGLDQDGSRWTLAFQDACGGSQPAD